MNLQTEIDIFKLEIADIYKLMNIFSNTKLTSYAQTIDQDTAG